MEEGYILLTNRVQNSTIVLPSGLFIILLIDMVELCTVK